MVAIWQEKQKLFCKYLACIWYILDLGLLQIEAVREWRTPIFD